MDHQMSFRKHKTPFVTQMTEVKSGFMAYNIEKIAILHPIYIYTHHALYLTATISLILPTPSLALCFNTDYLIYIIHTVYIIYSNIFFISDLKLMPAKHLVLFYSCFFVFHSTLLHFISLHKASCQQRVLVVGGCTKIIILVGTQGLRWVIFSVT